MNQQEEQRLQDRFNQTHAGLNELVQAERHSLDVVEYFEEERSEQAAFNIGYHDYADLCEGAIEPTCPFPYDSAERAAWEDGYNFAMQQARIQ